MDPRQQRIAALIAEAEALEAQAEAAFTARDAAAAVDAYEEALVRREAAKLLDALGSTKTVHGGKNRNMHASERLRVSQGKNLDAPDPFVTAVNAAGFTMRSLSEKLRLEGYRVSHAFLRQCLNGTAAIREPLAKRIEALIGFRATKASWPKGWAKEPTE